ncbi:MAG: hypothetical protein ACJA0Q_001076 [Saprospiraceae bacterium]|jgi:hypothetical protein
MEKQFEEKQYLGYNQFNLLVRVIIAGGCLMSYFLADASSVVDDSSALFLLLGISVLVISLMLFFVLHIKTEIKDEFLLLSGFWTTRMVKIDLKNIQSCEKVKYSKFMLNRAVYNLHLKGKIKFFTSGTWAVELTDKEGLKYRIGTQRSDELCKRIKEIIK